MDRETVCRKTVYRKPVYLNRLDDASLKQPARVLIDARIDPAK